MKTSDFNFDLPDTLIAQYPPEKRGQSRLMTLDRVTGERTHGTVAQLPEILCGKNFLSPAGKKPLLVFNDTKVRKARLIGKSLESGAEAEFLLIENVGTRDKGQGTRDNSPKAEIISNTTQITYNTIQSPVPSPQSLLWKTLVKRAQRKKKGSVYIFYDCAGKEAARAEVADFDGEFLFLEFDRGIDDAWLDKHGHVPLPPYIKRKDTPADYERYQTIYAKQTGSAAAPTAGLHFTEEILNSLAAAGIECAFVTLHVALGTFLPVRSENIEDHVMHEEQFIITEETAQKIEKAKSEGRKIIAVGTTSLRTLESAFGAGKLKRGRQRTSIFIYPPYKLKIVDALFTNFHTPLSTLLMLVCAFADGAFNGRDLILESYAEAVREGYRFFSYGDAMLIH